MESNKKMLGGKNVLLGVTGGIAAYKAANLTSMLKKTGSRRRRRNDGSGYPFCCAPYF